MMRFRFQMLPVITRGTFLVSIVFSLSALTIVSAEPARLANSRLRLAFDTKTGNLAEFTALETGHSFVAPQLNNTLWQIQFRGSSDATIVLSPTNSHSFRFEQTGASSARLVWSAFQAGESLPGAAMTGLKVAAIVTLDSAQPLSRWRIAVEHCGASRVQEIRFPCIQNVTRQEKEFLAVPVWMGQIAANPRELLNAGGKPRELRYPYPGLASMQCLAFYSDGGPGLYFSCDDTNAFHKSFAFSGDGLGGMGSGLIQLPENALPAQDYSQPYDAIVGAFSGDWLTAAQIYRSWATNQYWACESRLLRGGGQNWPKSTALWVWNRGRSGDVLDPALVLQQKLGLPVSAMWHWWHGCAYDIGFPEYLPPREGRKSFSEALRKAHRQHVHAIVYMNQRLWGMTTKSWCEMGAENFAVLGANGKVNPEIYNTFTKSPCASMCMGTPFWRNHYAELAQQAVNLGVNGIYMDQACSSLACYNAAHGHSIGGGSYWMNGFRLLATDIRQRTNKSLALAGEGVGESWLPYLDLMLSLQVSKERYAGPDGWEPLPFFQAVYHPYALQYGNYSSLTMPPYDELWPQEFAPKEPLKLLDRKFSTQFYLEQARAFVWGQQPTIANFRPSHFRDRPQEMDYLLRLAKLRHRALPFLRDGTFVRPPRFEVETRTVDFSRLSIYAGQQGALSAFEKQVPMAVAGAWIAPNGNLGVAIASVIGEPLRLQLHLDSKCELADSAMVYRIEEDGRRKIGRFDARAPELQVALGALEACVLEFRRN